jgi:hypothetical protein
MPALPSVPSAMVPLLLAIARAFARPTFARAMLLCGTLRASVRRTVSG